LLLRIILSKVRLVSDPAFPPEARLTPQRRVVLETMKAWRGTFTVTELHDRARRAEPKLGLATTYRTIELLRESGSIRPLAGGEPGLYIRCHPGHHHHLVCSSCGDVEETELCGAPSEKVLAERYGFAAETHELEIYGTCARCSAA
jgi:Fur family ferric uptake transcriptional regulator